MPIGTLANGRYELIELLGSSSLAEMYRAYQRKPEREVAIKLLNRFLAEDPAFKTRFERLAVMAARLKHPHIAQIYEYEHQEQGNLYYIVMEYAPGGSLREYLVMLAERGERMAVGMAVRICREIGSALAYLHASRILHQDIKPSNILLGQDHRAMLTDISTTNLVTMEPDMTEASGGGAPAYMSPEQGLGERADARSDLYALGVTMFQMLTGKLPYVADTPVAFMLKHMHEPIPSIRALRDDVPAALDALVTRLLAKAREDRYQTADALVADLEKIESLLVAPAKPFIFISYSSKNREFVLRLSHALKARGYDVWLDVERITGRRPYWNEIQQGVESCGHFVFVVSPDSIAEDSGALTELYHAAGLKPRPRIVPLMAQVTPLASLPILISPGRYQIHDFVQQPYDQALEKLLAALT